MKHNSLILLFLATMICGNMVAQSQRELGQLMRNRGEYYFTLNVQDPSEIQTINRLCSVDGTDGKTVVCYANQQQYDRLVKEGYKPSLQTPPSLKEEAVMWEGGDRATYEWDSYLTYEQYETMMESFPSSAISGRTCTLLDLGTLSTSNHRKILGVRLNNGQPNGKPKFLYTSTMHGDEVTGMILMLRLIQTFCTSTDARITNILDNVDLFIFPCTNPDGTYAGGNSTVNGATRANGNNIDLNRHFPDFDDGAHPDGETYYQDETQWMMQLAQEHLFTMGANFHGGAEVVNYPWDTYQPLHTDDDWWQYVSREYADLAHAISSTYMTYLDNGITNGYAWYTITGSRQDYMNYYGQCRELTIECSNTKTPNASTLPNYWNYNYNSMLTFIEECNKGIHGIVYDATTGQPLSGVIVTVQDHDALGSSVSTHAVGDFHRPIKGGTYSLLFEKQGYCPTLVDVTVTDGGRVDLEVELEPGNCILANFSASSRELFLGQSIDFTDNSTGEIASWNWTFEGATPATSTLQNPTGITYNTAGNFDVTLVITDSEGNSQTITKNDYIHVTSAYLMQNGNITTCDALFYDSGGPDSNYTNSLDYTLTFHPESEGALVTVTFSQFTLELNYDFLYIYDGSDTEAELIGEYTGNNSPGTVTASNEAGTLTFHFTSDNSVNKTGWVATVSCNYPNHNITATAEPSEAGTVQGFGTYAHGETCTLTATANEGYAFDHWSENGIPVSSEANYTFEVLANRNLIAHFIEASNLHWTAVHAPYADNMTMNAIVQIDGVEQFVNTLEIGVFAGDECRGNGVPMLFPYNNRYVYCLVIAGQAGESFSFRLYDHATETELTPGLQAPSPMAYNLNGIGSPVNPYVLNFTSGNTTAVQETTLDVGWNWWSSFITFDNNTLSDIQNQMAEAGANAYIKSQFDFSNNIGSSWTGSLNSLDNTQLYLIRIDRSITFTISGTKIDPTALPILIKPGWNWFAYPLDESREINSVLGDIQPMENDMIKCQNDFATYHNGVWNGTLENLEPGKGYIYLSRQSQNFSLIFSTGN